MRRSDHDVADMVRTTDPAAVAAEVIRLARRLFPNAPVPALERAFADADRMYRGEHRDYLPCDTEYHDIQHVLEVTLAMARLMDGYQRGGRNGYPELSRDLFLVGVLAALFHDFGYLRRRNDHKHRNGAEYTLTHVSRGANFLRGYLRELGVEERLAQAAAALVHFTGYERPVEAIRLGDDTLRRMGNMLGTAPEYPAELAGYLARCHAAGQARPTPLLLRYGAGDYNCLHRDLYGELVFPLQVAILLSRPEQDFSGGEFVLTEQRPRRQSRVHVVPLQQGDAVVFAVNERPVTGTVKGNDVAIEIKVDFEGTPAVVTYTGQIESATSMKGKVLLGEFEGTWTATKN